MKGGTYSSIGRVVNTLDSSLVAGHRVELAGHFRADDSAHVANLGCTPGEDEGQGLAAVVVFDVVGGRGAAYLSALKWMWDTYLP